MWRFDISYWPIIWYHEQQPANYCESYPVQNYTLIVTGSSLKSNVHESINSTSETTELKISVDLVENAKYIFQVYASNHVGTTETNGTTICELFCLFPDSTHQHKCLPVHNHIHWNNKLDRQSTHVVINIVLQSQLMFKRSECWFQEIIWSLL